MSYKAGKAKRIEKRSARNRLVKQVFLQHKIINCLSNRTISRDICALFAPYMYSTLSSWVIISGKCNLSTISDTTTSQLTQGRLKDRRHSVFRSSLCKGHFARVTFRLIKAPMHNFQEICCRPNSQGNQVTYRNHKVSFPSFAPNSHNRDILQASLDGQGYAGEKPFDHQRNWGMNKKFLKQIRQWYVL